VKYLTAGRIDQIKSNKASVQWQSPSNLAIIKYWGKHGVQLPRNPSISFTLDEAHTITSIAYKKKSSGGVEIDFSFEGKTNELFQNKLQKFLSSIITYFPFLEDLQLTIVSENSFPHSSGIASSASAMSAIALCLCDIERMENGSLSDDQEFFEKASYIARLGSGSASRSVYGGMAMWGASEKYKPASDDYAVPYTEHIDEVFRNFHDDILIVSRAEKSVSSTAGHALMNDNIYATNRYQQANDRMSTLLTALQDGDVATFGEICEDEALTLHALMMCSKPSYILMEPASIAIINEIRRFRKEYDLPVYFSLDAGPNIHLLYPDHITEQVSYWKEDVLQAYCIDGKIISDKVGAGPKKLG
jgi:diphosphomevalonate decarboxylase